MCDLRRHACPGWGFLNSVEASRRGLSEDLHRQVILGQGPKGQKILRKEEDMSSSYLGVKEIIRGCLLSWGADFSRAM